MGIPRSEPYLRSRNMGTVAIGAMPRTCLPVVEGLRDGRMATEHSVRGRGFSVRVDYYSESLVFDVASYGPHHGPVLRSTLEVEGVPGKGPLVRSGMAEGNRGRRFPVNAWDLNLVGMTHTDPVSQGKGFGHLPRYNPVRVTAEQRTFHLKREAMGGMETAPRYGTVGFGATGKGAAVHGVFHRGILGYIG
jgi:hypothetical protein